MPSFDAYERNLLQRLEELRHGDAAYTVHCDAVIETLPYEAADAPEVERQRVLDVGCGLGFLTARLAQWPDVDVTGIDPSAKAIDVAQSEHRHQPNIEFHVGTVDTLDTEPFDRAIINMVLHSVDDDTCLEILSATRDKLKVPAILTAIVPGQNWLVDKLITSALSKGMERREGTPWIIAEMQKQEVELTFGISGQPSYQEAIIVYNRSLADYGRLLLQSGFGLEINVRDPQTMHPRSTITTAYWEWSDHTAGYELSTKDRHILMTQTR